MKVTMMLADYAQVADGKLNIIGGGWTVTGGAPNSSPFAIAVAILVPWDQTNVRHALLLELLDADGTPVRADGNPVNVTGEFEVGRPPNVPHGIPLEYMMALNFGPIPLPPGQRWQWRLKVNGEILDSCEFSTRPQP